MVKVDDDIMLSIVIPHYNSPDLLRRLLTSIPNIPEIEVIVIDDHSDKYIEEFNICRRDFSERNILFKKNDIDKKYAGTARNAGIMAAHGEYILFADADDWFVEGMWEYIKPYLGKADIVYFPPTSCDKNGNEGDRHIEYERLVKENILKKSNSEIGLRVKFISPCSKIIKKGLIDKYNIRFDECKYANDVMFSLKCGLYAFSIMAANDAIYCIFCHQKGLTTVRSKEAILAREKVLVRYYKELKAKLSHKDMSNLGYSYGSNFYYYFIECRYKIYEMLNRIIL